MLNTHRTHFSELLLETLNYSHLKTRSQLGAALSRGDLIEDMAALLLLSIMKDVQYRVTLI